MDNLEPLVVPYYMDCLTKGYRYECSCGGLHREERHAWSCRQCRTSLSESSFDSRKVLDIASEYAQR